jgi:hypothetical protein
MVLEAVLFTIMIVLSVIFVLQVAPPPVSSTGGRSYAQWKILCDDALRGMEISPQTQNYIIGDLAPNNIIDVGDTVFFINWLQRQTGPPPNPIYRADCNCDGTIEFNDIQYLLAYLFLGGPAPNCEYKLSDESILATYNKYYAVF